MSNEALPIAIIGAGPVGLAAAAHVLERGERPIIFEAGDTVGASMLAWGHVRVFTPWRYVTDKASVALLEARGWRHPEREHFPTGGEIVHDYLKPLAEVPQIKSGLRLQRRVRGVARRGFDKMKSAGREHAPFVITVETPEGEEQQYLAKAVIDASGTYTKPNPLGANGTPALGEGAAKAHIFYGIPDVMGKDRARYAGQKVLVVGSGHSAFNAVLDLLRLAEDASGTEITWAVRRDSIGQMFGGGADDALSARGELGAAAKRQIEEGKLRFVTRFRAAEVRRSAGQVEVVSDDGQVEAADEIIVTTGFRPDLGMLSEMRLDLDAAVESPTRLAPLIDPNIHSCGTVPPHGFEELRQPESDFYIVGMKSYGRAPTFLLLTGYEQVRSVVAAIVGDWEAAREVRLELPETGVCVTDSDSGAACCGTSEANKVGSSGGLINVSSIPVALNLLQTTGLQPVTLQTTTRACGCDDTCCGDGVRSTTCGCDTACCA